MGIRVYKPTSAARRFLRNPAGNAGALEDDEGKNGSNDISDKAFLHCRQISCQTHKAALQRHKKRGGQNKQNRRGPVFRFHVFLF